MAAIQTIEYVFRQHLCRRKVNDRAAGKAKLVAGSAVAATLTRR
jgi:hypothetical protein